MSAAIASPAAGQKTTDDFTRGTKLVISQNAIARTFAAERRAIVQPERRDSLKNGVIIGAVVGAAAFAGFTAWICAMEEGDTPCLDDMLRIGAIGAGVGAAAGAGIDALAARRTPLPIVRVRF